jgi:hypothetical protein
LKNHQLAFAIASITALSMLVGCSSGYQYGAPDEVIVDTLGVDPYSYEVDLADCEAYAVQVSVGQRTAEGVVEGGVVGGVLGAVLGNSESAKRGAGAGAIVGGVKGNKSARHEQDRIVKRCLKGRGYRVLN